MPRTSSGRSSARALPSRYSLERAHPRVERRGLRRRHRRVRRVADTRRRAGFSSAFSLSPNWMKQMPRSVAPIISMPSGVCRGRVRDRKAAAALAVLQRRHAEPRVDALVDAARRAESGVVDRIGDAAAGLEAGLELLDAFGFLEFLRREADARFETCAGNGTRSCRRPTRDPLQRTAADRHCFEISSHALRMRASIGSPSRSTSGLQRRHARRPSRSASAGVA